MAVGGAVGEGAGTGRCVDSCQSPWSRTSGALHASPAEMGTGAQEKTMRQLGAETGPPHPLPAWLELGVLPPDSSRKHRQKLGWLKENDVVGGCSGVLGDQGFISSSARDQLWDYHSDFDIKERQTRT